MKVQEMVSSLGCITCATAVVPQASGIWIKKPEVLHIQSAASTFPVSSQATWTPDISSFMLQSCSVSSAGPSKRKRSNCGSWDMGVVEHRVFFVPPSEPLETYTSV